MCIKWISLRSLLLSGNHTRLLLYYTHTHTHTDMNTHTHSSSCHPYFFIHFDIPLFTLHVLLIFIKIFAIFYFYNIKQL